MLLLLLLLLLPRLRPFCSGPRSRGAGRGGRQGSCCFWVRLRERGPEQEGDERGGERGREGAKSEIGQSLLLTTAPCSSPPAWPVVSAGARARTTSRRWSSGRASRPFEGREMRRESGRAERKRPAKCREREKRNRVGQSVSLSVFWAGRLQEVSVLREKRGIAIRKRGVQAETETRFRSLKRERERESESER